MLHCVESASAHQKAQGASPKRTESKVKGRVDWRPPAQLTPWTLDRQQDTIVSPIPSTSGESQLQRGKPLPGVTTHKFVGYVRPSAAGEHSQNNDNNFRRIFQQWDYAL